MQKVFVNKQPHGHSYFLIQQILQLAKNNFMDTAQYFSSQLITQINDHNPPDYQQQHAEQDQDTSNHIIEVKRSKLQELYNYLQMNSIVLLRKFANIQHLYNGDHWHGLNNQYYFLRKIWENKSNPTQLDYGEHIKLQDKLDNINRKISTIRQHTRKLVQAEQQHLNNYWNNQLAKQVNSNVWEHPFFQIMNKDLKNMAMKYEELSMKYRQVDVLNTSLCHKNREYESKIAQYKDKNRRMEKQLFQIAKKKSQLEKLIIENQYKGARLKSRCKQIKTVGHSDGRLLQQSHKLQAQNHECLRKEVLNKQAQQYILLLQQDDQRLNTRNIQNCNLNSNYSCHSHSKLKHIQDKRPNTDIKQKQNQEPHFNPMAVKQKYRHAKNIVKRTTTVVSPNTSIDSIKNVRFQRSSLKKLIIRGQ